MLKNAFYKLEYFIMSSNRKNLNLILDDSLAVKKIGSQDIKNLSNEFLSPFNKNFLIKRIKKNANLYDGYLLYKDNTQIGICFILKKGANDVILKIRNSDFYICKVYIKPEFRGNNYAPIFLSKLINYYSTPQENKIFSLAVCMNNKSAINAYKKLGFKIQKKISFYRALRINIPYKSI